MLSSLSRRVAVIATASAVALGLVACGDDTEAGNAVGANQDGAEDTLDIDSALPTAPKDFAGMSSLLNDIDLDTIDETEETGVHAPGLALDITGTAQTATISAEAYEDITGDTPPRDDDGERPSEVRAEDGHLFVVASFETRDPQWEPRGKTPETKAVLQVESSDVTQLFSTEDGSRHSSTIVASVPQDAEPEDAVIEIETAKAYQSVSLLTGERVDTDMPQAYPGPHEVTIESAEELDTSFDHFIDGDTPVQGKVVDAFTTPYLDQDGGDGWSAPGQVYLSVEVDWNTPVHTTYNETVTRVEADGETFQAVNDPSSLVEWFADNVVFQIPADLGAVEVVVEAAYQNGPTTSSKLVEFDPITAVLAFD